MGKIYDRDYQFHDTTTGAVLASGSLEFLVPDTTTQKTVYSDSALSVSLGATVSLNALGRPESAGSPVDVYGSGNFDVRIKNSAGTILLTVEDKETAAAAPTSPVTFVTNVAALLALASADLTDGDRYQTEGYTTSGDGGGALYIWDDTDATTHNGGTHIQLTEGGNGRFIIVDQQGMTLLHWGCIGDGDGAGGGTNDATAFQAAIDSAVYTLDGLGKTYRIDSAIAKTVSTTGYRKKVVNCRLDYANLANSATGLKWIGTLGSAVSTVSSITKGSSTVLFGSTAGVSVGDWHLFTSADNFATLGASKQGEWNQVREVTSGTVLTYEREMLLGYSSSIVVYSPTLVEQIILEDVELLGAGEAKGSQAGVWAELCQSFHCSRVVSRDWDAYHVVTQKNVNFTSTDCVAINADHDTGLSYGTTITATHDSATVTNPTGRNLRHVVTIGSTDGIVWHPAVIGGTGTGLTEGALDTHQGCAYPVFIGGTWDFKSDLSTSGSGDGIIVQGAYVHVADQTLIGPIRHGVLLQPSTDVSDDFVICKNIVVTDFGTNTAGASAAGVAFGIEKQAGAIDHVDIDFSAEGSNAVTRGFQLSAGSTAADTTIDKMRVRGIVSVANRAFETDPSYAWMVNHLDVEGIWETSGSTECVYFSPLAAADLPDVRLNGIRVIGGTHGVRSIAGTIAGSATITGAATANTAGTMNLQLLNYAETLTGTSNTIEPEGSTSIDSSGGVFSGTLGSGRYIGQIKTLVCTAYTSAATVTVTNHVTTDGEVGTFTAVDDYWVLQWMGTEWANVISNGVTGI